MLYTLKSQTLVVSGVFCHLFIGCPGTMFKEVLEFLSWMLEKGEQS